MGQAYIAKVSLVGNCQTKALTWYIRKLNPNLDVAWIYPGFLPEHFQQQHFRGKQTPTIINLEDGVQRLKSSDYVIFQPIQIKKSKYFNYIQIKRYAAKAKTISINSFFFSHREADHRSLRKMINKNIHLGVDIPGLRILNKCIKALKCSQPNHPSAVYFLELMREICLILKWNYYSDEQYEELLKKGYPFG